MGCCGRSYLPLTLAYARTIHKFQGLSAGPVDLGKIANMYDCIVCDPDQKRFEGSNIGLLYTAVSRATTLGDPDGLNSAIYFKGEHFKGSRIRQIGKKAHSVCDYEDITRRKRWVAHLKERTKPINLKKKKITEILDWSKKTRITYTKLAQRTANYTSSRVTKKRKRTAI